MKEERKRELGYYFFIVASIVCFLINGIIFYTKFEEWNTIKMNSQEVTATVIKEEQNFFGGNKSYKYLFSYYFDEIKYEVFESGMYEHGFYQITQKVQIVVDKKEPNVFVVKEKAYQYQNHLIISLISLLVFAVLIKFKSKII